MAIPFNDMPLRRKVILIALVSTSVSLLSAFCVIILNERLTFPKTMGQNLSNLAQIIGDNCSAALSFNDNKTAQEVLNTLKANPHIRKALLFDAKRGLVAQYPAGSLENIKLPEGQKDGVGFTPDGVTIFRFVLAGRERLGTLYLESDLGEMKSRLLNYSVMTILIWVAAFLISLVVASRLEKRVTQPLRLIVEKMQDIARGEGDLTKRLEVSGEDEIAEVAAAFNTYVEKLQTVDEMKLGLISVVSHQLKTPVAEVNGYIENMLEGLAGEVTPKQRQYLEDMREIGKENYRLICDLLSASKIERGVVSVNLNPVSAKRLVELSIRDYEEPIRGKGLKLFLRGLENDFKVYADQDKTVETIRNLINNAVKCTDHGSLTIAIEDLSGQGVIEVRDTGIGMSRETMDRLFTKSRVMGKEAGRAGAGLGLYIAKNFMRLQKGDVTVTSELGKGSCFRLTIPKVPEPGGVKV